MAAPAPLLHTVAPAARAPAAALGAGVGRHLHSTVQYSTVQYSTVQYSTVQYSVDCHLPTPGSKAAVERTNFKGHYVNIEIILYKMHKRKFLG